MIKLYTLSNCDTCKNALKWLSDNDVAFENFDIRKDGIDTNILRNAIDALGWQKVVNRRSTTWRQLDEIAREGIDDEKAVGLIIDNVTLMKRPFFIVGGGKFFVGFDDAVREALLS